MSDARIAWAALLTHDQDAEIEPGHGVLLVLPRGGADASEAALALARAIPCSGKLALTVERPVVRPFDVTAKVKVEPGADPAKIRAEAERQMRELVDVGETAALVEHVGVGADDHSFGWRPRYVVRHVPGVTGATVLINGSTDEITLGPRELPALRSFEIADMATGDAL